MHVGQRGKRSGEEFALPHLTKRAPILGIGAGERMNIDPYGLDPSEPVTRLEEALQIVRLCLSTQGPITFSGKHYRLDNALMDLKPARGKAPQIWIAGHGPRMLGLTGRYGDGWYPTAVVSPREYATKLATVRAAAHDAGRDPASITPALHRFTLIGATEQEARAMLAIRASTMACGRPSTARARPRANSRPAPQPRLPPNSRATCGQASTLRTVHDDAAVAV